MGLLAAMAGAAAAQAPSRIIEVQPSDWARQPTTRELYGILPRKLMREGRGGAAAISCRVGAEGDLEDCKVAVETPQGYGLGKAALALAPKFRMKATTGDGQPTEGGTVRIPIVMQSTTMLGDGKTKVVSDPPWARAPSAAAMKAAYPKGAARIPGGSATMRCAFAKDGGVMDCRVLSQEPALKGFGQAALDLAPGFAVEVGQAVAALTDYLVDIRFAFHNPDQAGDPRIAAPQWIRGLAPESAEAIFPRAARELGLLEGVGAVDCAANISGELVDCRVAREDPPGLGFGAAALEAARLLRMNPWTAEGEPVDGRRLTVPVRLKRDASPALPATP